MGLIKLTVYADTVWIHPDAVMMVEPRYGTAGVQGTLITLRNGAKVGVQESVETVVGRIDGTRNDKKAQQWVSVKDRLPEVADAYIIAGKQRYPGEPWEYFTDVAGSHGSYIDDFWDTFNDWVEGQETHVTHWMPLPEPPEEDN